ncbi:MAG: DegT/DnrJ/EryC1/StrS family aminotransferase [Nitrospirota bacterium]|jgi:UDP-2-acetamido-2-deoxy-ribo-hexuluronate aminotransferase
MIQMVNLKKHFEEIRDEVVDTLIEVLESTRYVLGPHVEEFERAVADYCGAAEGVGVASGTDALHLSVKGLGIGKGDEVITTPFTFFATVESIMYENATPVFADIEPDTFNIDPAKIEQRITPRTRAIMPVHMFGHPADMDGIMDIARRHGLRVIEDCAQAFGAGIRGRKVGGFGDTGCFSFYPSKNLGAFGDGGMVVMKHNGAMAAEMRRLRNHGSRGGYAHESVGFNSRLDELQAAFLLIKMKRIDTYNEKRRAKAALYTEALSPHAACPVQRDGCVHVYHQYTIRTARRDEVQRKLREAGIASTIYYPVPVHLQPAMASMGFKAGDYPVAEQASREVLSLPICPETEESTISRVSEVIAKV